MLAAGTWSREAGLECLDIGSGTARSWPFFWPGAIVVTPLTDGIVWEHGDGRCPLPLGASLRASPNAPHVRILVPAGARAKVTFTPADDIAPTIIGVFMPEIIAAGDERETLRPRAMIPSHVRRAYRALAELGAALTLSELAAVADLERCYLCRSYQRAVGLPPYRHRQHLRVARARALLRAGVDCTRVAHLVGFCDQSHFTRSFKELTGTPPSDYARTFGGSLQLVA